MPRHASDERTSVGRKCFRAKVLFPEPLGPIRTTRDSLGMEIFKSFTAISIAGNFNDLSNRKTFAILDFLVNRTNAAGVGFAGRNLRLLSFQYTDLRLADFFSSDCYFLLRGLPIQ